MPETPFTPRPGSLVEQIARWFRDNPGKELSTPQAEKLFNATQSSTRAALGTLEDANFLGSRREGVTNVYSAGPALATWQGADAPHPPASGAPPDHEAPPPRA